MGFETMRLQVCRFGPNAWQFVPAGLKTVRDTKESKCRCNGNGDLGRVVKQDDLKVQVSYQLACPCLYVQVDSENQAEVVASLMHHWHEISQTGLLCRCMFCEKKRMMEEELAPA